MTTDLVALAREIQALSPPDRLRLAADLLEAKHGDLAHDIAMRVVEELGAVLALADMRREPKS